MWLPVNVKVKLKEADMHFHDNLERLKNFYFEDFLISKLKEFGNLKNFS